MANPDTKSRDRIPVILPGRTLRSLRDSGYSLAAAIGEVIDNSVEANANKIQVLLSEATDARGKRHVNRISVIDDGNGMDIWTLQRYPQIGFSTRYMSTTTIGKYGVGAKLGAIGFSKRIDVWSREAATKAWRHVFLDLDILDAAEKANEEPGIDPTDEDPIPADLSDLGLEGASGTVVVWSHIDRLEEGFRAANFDELRLQVEKELSRMFRRFIDGGIVITVNGNELIPHDPLFLMEGSWADKRLRDYYGRKEGKAMADKIGLSWTQVPDHFGAHLIGEEEFAINGSTVTLRVTLYPEAVVRKRGLGGDRLSLQLRVPENEGAISFMRLNREINYTTVPRIFPIGIQESDRFIGIEVSFTPELDEYFGVRNVKRGVEPHDELRARIRDLLRRHVTEARRRLEDYWGEASRKSQAHEGEHADLVQKAADADRMLPKSRAAKVEDDADRDRILDDLAQDTGKKSAEEKQAYLDRIKDLPFVMESVNSPGKEFIITHHLGHQIIIRLNTRHPFYREMWEPIKELAEASPGVISGEEATRTARRTLEALTLLVIAYGKAESMHEEPHEQYDDLRSYWGQFLATLLGKVKASA